jgi:2-polyprenyl-3-methyl-5-hydroxy-6-metoxy-1,4-benzoquinol methylase
MSKADEHNLEVRWAWNTNAWFWDERMADGNEFFTVLVWPAVERLLGVSAGLRILDIACGNGVTSRRLFATGAHVVGIDFSETLIDLAKSRSPGGEIDYKVVDATDYDALRSLGEAAFDRALCNMALMDMAEIRPLLKALARVLRPGGSFVFSVLHPCFNNPTTIQMAELEDREGRLTTIYSVKISKYMTPYTRLGAAMHGQPVPHPYFHRSLESLLAPGLEAGFVLDALEERTFPPDHSGGTTAISWSGRFSEIPPVLVARMRRTADNEDAAARQARRSPRQVNRGGTVQSCSAVGNNKLLPREDN